MWTLAPMVGGGFGIWTFKPFLFRACGPKDPSTDIYTDTHTYVRLYSLREDARDPKLKVSYTLDLGFRVRFRGSVGGGLGASLLDT
jgi:hypothetical protein